MICCKVHFVYEEGKSSLDNLFNNLDKYGDIILNGQDELFFASHEEKMDKKLLRKIFKKCGFLEFLINEYTKDNQPKEDDYFNNWIYSKILENNCLAYEKANQEQLQYISKKLDEMNEMLDAIEVKEEKENDQGGQEQNE